MRLTKSLTLLAISAVVLLASHSVYAAIAWQTPGGATANFTYANGDTDNQLFVPALTSPVVTPTSLLFFPSQFKADAANGSAEVTSDVVRFEIHTLAGKELSSVIVNEYGDYSILGSGPVTAVKAFGGLFLVNMDSAFPFDILQASLVTVPVPLNSLGGVTSGQGAWTGSETVINIPAGWKNIQFILNNELHAGSDPGTSSVIEKKVVTAGLEIFLEVVPEPGTLGLCLLGSAMLLARRSGRRLAA